MTINSIKRRRLNTRKDQFQAEKTKELNRDLFGKKMVIGCAGFFIAR
jgi:hypothetical protein